MNVIEADVYLSTEEFVFIILACVIGGIVITFGIAHFYYKRKCFHEKLGHVEDPDRIPNFKPRAQKKTK